MYRSVILFGAAVLLSACSEGGSETANLDNVESLPRKKVSLKHCDQPVALPAGLNAGNRVPGSKYMSKSDKKRFEKFYVWSNGFGRDRQPKLALPGLAGMSIQLTCKSGQKGHPDQIASVSVINYGCKETALPALGQKFCSGGTTDDTIYKIAAFQSKDGKEVDFSFLASNDTAIISMSGLAAIEKFDDARKSFFSAAATMVQPL